MGKRIEGGIEIRFHIAAEVLTGGVFVAAGIGLLANHTGRWPTLLSALALGMLAYSLVQSPGHYLERGERRMAWVFASAWVLAIPAIVVRFTAR